MSTLYVDNLQPNLGSQVEIPNLKPVAGTVIQEVIGGNAVTYSSGATNTWVSTFSFSIDNCVAGSKVLIECDPAGLMEHVGAVVYSVWKGSTNLGSTTHNGSGNGGWRTPPTMIRGEDTNVTAGTNTYTFKFYSSGPFMYINYQHPSGYWTKTTYKMTEIAQ